MKVFVFDAAHCNGCHNCQLGCKDEMVDNEWIPYSKPQPDIGHFWCGLEEIVHGQFPKVKVEYRIKTCHHCDNAPCVNFAPEAVFKREDGLVIINPIKAQGRRDIVSSCPYGAIWWNEELDLPQKCTGCAHLVDEGELPHCVDLCPTGGWRFGEEEDFATELVGANRYSDEEHKGRVYYINLPGLFISGEVWDPIVNEVVEEAKVTLFRSDGEVLKTTFTDSFGDFWFRKLEVGDYRIAIETVGFKTIQTDVCLDMSKNIGAFPLERKV